MDGVGDGGDGDDEDDGDDGDDEDDEGDEAVPAVLSPELAQAKLILLTGVPEANG